MRKVGQRPSIELRLEPVEKRVQTWQEAWCCLLRDPTIRHEQVRRVGLWDELVTENRVFTAWHLGNGRDVPFVFEYARRVPDEYLPCRVITCRSRYEFDAAAGASFDDGGCTHQPLAQTLGRGNGIPHVLDTVVIDAPERQRRILAVFDQRALSRQHT